MWKLLRNFPPSLHSTLMCQFFCTILEAVIVGLTHLMPMSCDAYFGNKFLVRSRNNSINQIGKKSSHIRLEINGDWHLFISIWGFPWCWILIELSVFFVLFSYGRSYCRHDSLMVAGNLYAFRRTFELIIYFKNFQIHGIYQLVIPGLVSFIMVFCTLFDSNFFWRCSLLKQNF